MFNFWKKKTDKNFWARMPRPIFALAPMEEVTDVAFRQMFAKYSGKINQSVIASASEAISIKLGIAASSRPFDAKRPGLLAMTEEDQGSKLNPFVMYTEFVNVDGLTHPEGRKKLEIDLKFTPEQRPMVAQIWGTNPDKFYEAAKICASLGFDGIDINMGCPQDREIGLGACAALIRQPELAKEIIKAVKKGAGDLPVSVKTRIGYSKKEELDDWIKFLLNQNLAVVALHGRTKQEKSKVPANWEAIAKAVQIRNELKSTTLILGNGDIKSRTEALERINQSGADGAMVGRGAFGYPWFFREDNYEPGVKERLVVMLEHARLFNQWLPGKPFVIMRKHFKAYVSGFPGSHELRAELMQAKNLEETENIVNNYLKILA